MAQSKAKKKPKQPEPELGCQWGTDKPKTRKKLAIVGFAPSTMRDVVSYIGDPEWEIWGVESVIHGISKVTGT